MEFMHEGGFAMWPSLITAVAVCVWAWRAPPAKRAGLLLGGAVLVLGLGVLGLSTGIHATVYGLQRAGDTIPMEDQVKILAQGMRESANNGVLCGALVAMLSAFMFMARHHAAQQR